MNSPQNPARQIFLDAVENYAPAQWPAYLTEACGEDQDLRRRIEILLQAHVADESLLDAPAIAAETAEFRENTEQSGDTIGPYKLLQQIGEGGMGAVYMAQQTEPIERRVALKIIKPGMDSRQVIARFEAERQALAMMDHPNIAKVIDAGMTEAGRPYFVMELVKGVPITEYCDQHQLTPRERLKLFMPVCQAVQHAHQKGIIHRDIKPSNVLVAHYDDHPVPKVIDFGVAKAIDHRLTEKTMFTEFGQVLGTVEYMSPEQARLNQWEVDTRSDIYSLGVMLYELLAGDTPFDRHRLRSSAFDEVLRMIRDEEPPIPSMRLSGSKSLPSIAANRQIEPDRLSMLLRGDLDWIVMKAMEKDRTRRYDTANGLKMDILRYLEGDPVTAAPPSALYRARKFVNRHRVAVVVSLLLASVLLLAVVGTSIGMARALVEKSRADREAKVAQTARERAERAGEEAKYWQYISNIPAAQSFLDEYATGTARAILKNAPAEYRDFEWALLANRAWPRFDSKNALDNKDEQEVAKISQFWKLGTVRVTQEIFPAGNAGGLPNGRFSPDGKSIFFNLSNGVIKKFLVESGDLQARYTTAVGHSIDVEPSPTGTKLAGFTFSNRAMVWQVAPAEEITSSSTSLRGPPWICRWSPDEKYLITGHMDGSIRVWNAISLALVTSWTGHNSEVTDLFISPASEFVWSASNDGKIQQRSFPEGQLLSEFEIPVAGELEYQAFSPQGTLACAVYRDGAHLLWDIQDEEVVARLAGPASNRYVDEPRRACSFSPDESCVAVMSGNLGITIYDADGGEVLNQISGNGLPLMAVHFSPDGKLVLTVSYDGRARIWTCVEDDDARLSEAHEDVIYQLDVDSNGDQLLLGSFDSTASVWNLRNNRRQEGYTRHDAEILAVDLHPGGTLAATLDARGVLRVWDTVTSSTVYVINPESDEFADHIGGSGKAVRANLINYPAVLSSGIFTPDGERLVAFHHGRMKVFDAHTGEVETELEDATFSGWPVYSYDSSLVAILEMYGKSAGVWNLRTGKMLHRSIEHREAMVMLDFSPVDQRIVSTAMEAGVNIWDAKSGGKLQTLKVQSGNVISCHFSRDGKFVLAGYGDSTARIWDANTGELVTTLVGHNNRVRDVRFNPDQTRLLSWSMDNRAIIWDLTRPFANQLLVLGGESKLIQARWTADGRDIITAWSDGHVEVWRGASRSDIAKLKIGDEGFEDALSSWQSQYTNTVAE